MSRLTLPSRASTYSASLAAAMPVTTRSLAGTTTRARAKSGARRSSARTSERGASLWVRTYSVSCM